MSNKWSDILPKKLTLYTCKHCWGDNNDIPCACDIERSVRQQTISDCLSALEKAQANGKICWVMSEDEFMVVLSDMLSKYQVRIGKSLYIDAKKLVQAILSKLRGDNKRRTQ